MLNLKEWSSLKLAIARNADLTHYGYHFLRVFQLSDIQFYARTFETINFQDSDFSKLQYNYNICFDRLNDYSLDLALEVINQIISNQFATQLLMLPKALKASSNGLKIAQHT